MDIEMYLSIHPSICNREHSSVSVQPEAMLRPLLAWLWQLPLSATTLMLKLSPQGRCAMEHCVFVLLQEEITPVLWDSISTLNWLASTAGLQLTSTDPESHCTFADTLWGGHGAEKREKEPMCHWTGGAVPNISAGNDKNGILLAALHILYSNVTAS